MKKFIFVISLVAITSSVHAGTRVAVSSFKDKSAQSRCYVGWYGNELGTGMSDQLITALMDTGKFEVQERENLRTMYSEEHDLINADPSAAPKKNGFKAAHYSITGAITSFELCNNSLGGDLDVGGLIGLRNSGLKVGAKAETAKVVLDLRVIDVQSGRVLLSFASEGKSTSTKLKAEGDIQGADFGSEAFSSSPLGEATRKAITGAVSEIAQKLPAKTNVASAR